MVRYRPAGLEDAELASDLMTAAYPSLPTDPVITRLAWSQPRRGFAYGRYIGERSGTPIAYLAWHHAPWSDVPERSCEVEVWLDRARLDVGLLVDMLSWLGERAAADGAWVLACYCAEDEGELLQALARVGYRRERTERVWELDLTEHGGRIVGEARQETERMAGEGIRCTTLAAWTHPDRLKMLYDLAVATEQDIPHTLTIAPEAFEDFVVRLENPDRRAGRMWVALDGDRPVALSYLRYPPVRGMVWTGFTATARDHRGRGIARAIKLQTLAQAVALGVPKVGTDNDVENTPILRLNQRLGYRPRPGFVEHHKRVTSTGHA